MSGAAGRLLPRPRHRHDGYALCPEDGFWFRPAYTGGTCPLCGEGAPGGGPPPPLLARVDGSLLGMALLALVPLGMAALVLLVYFGG